MHKLIEVMVGLDQRNGEMSYYCDKSSWKFIELLNNEYYSISDINHNNNYKQEQHLHV